MAIIYHLVPESHWETARTESEYRADSLATEGFIHCSKDHPQALAVANRLYGGRQDMLVLEVETERLASPLKHEPSRSGEIYPHIHGPLNTGAVTGVLKLQAGQDGRFTALVADVG